MPEYPQHEGEFDEKAAGHPAGFWSRRGIRLDFRGGLQIDPTSDWGNDVMVITLSHDPANWGKTVARPVTVERDARIMSRALLYNCRIGCGAIVGAGAVVKSRDVPDMAVVDGNPAKIVGYVSPGAGVIYLESPSPLPRRSKG